MKKLHTQAIRVLLTFRWTPSAFGSSKRFDHALLYRRHCNSTHKNQSCCILQSPPMFLQCQLASITTPAPASISLPQYPDLGAKQSGQSCCMGNQTGQYRCSTVDCSGIISELTGSFTSSITLPDPPILVCCPPSSGSFGFPASCRSCCLSLMAPPSAVVPSQRLPSVWLSSCSPRACTCCEAWQSLLDEWCLTAMLES